MYFVCKKYTHIWKEIERYMFYINLLMKTLLINLAFINLYKQVCITKTHIYMM